MGRQVVHRVDGGVEVRAGRRSGVSDARRRAVLRYIADDGMTLKAAAERAGVKPAALYALKRADDGFSAELEAAQDAFGAHLEAEAYRRAVEGVERTIQKKNGEVVTVVERSDRLLERMLEARVREYRRERGTTVVVAVQPLTARDLEETRAAAREDLQSFEQAAILLAAGERERDGVRGGQKSLEPGTR